MQRLNRVLAFGLVLVAHALWAAEPWEARPYAEWTWNEVWRILDRSPWSKKIDLVWRERVDPEARLQYGPGFLVRWESALTVRQAKVRRRQLDGTLKDEDIKRFLSDAPTNYVVGLHGPIGLVFKGFEDEQVLSSTHLYLNGSKRRIRAMDLRFIRREASKDDGVVEFYFPKEQDGMQIISPSEKQLTFRCPVAESARNKYGLKLEVEFDLRKMVRDGKPDL